VASLRYDPASGKFTPAANLTPAPPAPGEGTFGPGVSGPSGDYWARMFRDSHATSADRLAAVYACAQVISSSIAAMPLHLYRADGDNREKITDHPIAQLLTETPNAAMTWPQLREAITYQTVLKGNQYTRVFWINGFPRELFPIPETAVLPKLTDARRLIYDVSANTHKIPPGQFTAPDIAHFKALSCDGLEGINPIEHCRLTTLAAAALTKYGQTSATDGGPIRGIITAATAFKNDTQAKEVRARWSEAFAAASHGNGVPIFEGGDMKFHPVSMSLRDAQFIEQMQFSVEEICRIFNVPPHMIQKLDRATFNNIEHLSRQFYTGTLVPWINRLEATLDRALLTRAERLAGYRFRHNAEGLLRGDLASRSDSYQKQISAAVMTPNEARRLEDRPPLPGGDVLLFPTNHLPLQSIPTTPPEP
jgi:HK97 family phage portal protein